MQCYPKSSERPTGLSTLMPYECRENPAYCIILCSRNQEGQSDGTRIWRLSKVLGCRTMPRQGRLCLSRSLGCKPDEPEECIFPVTRPQEGEDAEDAGRNLVWHVLCFLRMNGWIDKYDDARFYDVSCELVFEGWLLAAFLISR